MELQNQHILTSNEINEKPLTDLISSYIGPESLRLPFAGILARVKKLYASEGVNPGTYSLKIEGFGGDDTLGPSLKGAYDFWSGIYIIGINPFDPQVIESSMNQKDLRVIVDYKEKFVEIATPIALKYLGSPLESSLESAYREKNPENHAIFTKNPRVFPQITRLLNYLQSIDLDIISGESIGERFNDDPQFANIFLELCEAYVKDKDMQRYKLVPGGVHESSHKMMAEQTPYGAFIRRVFDDDSIWEVTVETQRSTINSTELGNQLRDSYMNDDKGSVERLSLEVLKIKARAVEDKLGVVKKQDFEAYTRAKGLDENLARVVSNKLTDVGVGHDTFTIFGYMMDNQDVSGGSFERLQEFLRNHQYKEILEMKLEDFIKKFY